MDDLVSICIPAYETPGFFKRVYMSAIEQDYSRFEIIVTDDSKTDAVEAIVHDHPDDRVRYERHASPLGSPANWNRAIDLAEGEWIKIMHHDDWFTHNTSLSRFMRILSGRPDINFAFTSAHVAGPDQQFRYTHQPAPAHIEQLKQDPAELYKGNFIGSPSETIYRRTKLRFDTRMRWLVDVDFYIRYLCDMPGVMYIDEPLITNTDGADHQLTRTCGNDRAILLYEWSLLTQTLTKLGLAHDEHVELLKGVFEPLQPGGPAELEKLGVPMPLPPMVLGALQPKRERWLSRLWRTFA